MKVITPRGNTVKLATIPYGGCFMLASSATQVYMVTDGFAANCEILTVNVGTGSVAPRSSQTEVYPVEMTCVESQA